MEISVCIFKGRLSSTTNVPSMLRGKETRPVIRSDWTALIFWIPPRASSAFLTISSAVWPAAAGGKNKSKVMERSLFFIGGSLSARQRLGVAAAFILEVEAFGVKCVARRSVALGISVL